VAALIKETSEKGGSEKFPLINPKKTADSLK
jgi:hypothetical protein